MIGPALRELIERCRDAPTGPAAEFGCGVAVDLARATDLVGSELLDALRSEGCLVDVGEAVHLAYALQAFNGLVSVLPARQEAGADFVHLNNDSFWLLKLAWRWAEPGTYAAELGTGNAIVAAHLVARYRRVIATDLPGPWMRYAQMTLQANRGRGRPSAVVACDVAGALRPGQFDLVVANSPWSPAPPLDNGRQVTFMDGGPTGTELPARFLDEAAGLLAPGGTSITLCLDTTFNDGSRPLQPTLDGIADAGFELEIVESAIFDPAVATAKLREHRLPDLARAEHIAVIIRRPR